jgi:D-sedoheptulose 7-phosphate isomerase
MTKDSSLSELITSYLAGVKEVLGRVPVGELEKVILGLEQARWKGRRVFTCRNGGSAATAIHFASDLQKGAMAPGKRPFNAESLCENISLLTTWANDVCYEEAFSRILGPRVKKGDVLIAISGSGNSPNVLNAPDLAKAQGATTIGFTGFEGGKLKHMVDIWIISRAVPCSRTRMFTSCFVTSSPTV